MKHTHVTYEQRRTYTIEAATEDFDEKKAVINGDAYELPDFYIRKALLADTMFCLDCQCNGFPAEVHLIPSDAPDVFDVVVRWTHTV